VGGLLLARDVSCWGFGLLFVLGVARLRLGGFRRWGEEAECDGFGGSLVCVVLSLVALLG